MPTNQTQYIDLYLYKIANQIYQSNVQIKVLESFNLNIAKITKKIVIETNPVENPVSNFRTIYNAKTWIGDTKYLISIKFTEKHEYYLKCDSQEYLINKSLICKSLVSTDDTVLLGPVLILNLALNDVFCLHASAFQFNDKVFILMGDSGTGKSTIANFMNNQPQCKRIADDILPLKIKGNELNILPNFPQLKLSKEQQYVGGKIIKQTIFLFARKTEEPTSIKAISNFNSTKNLIKHSVATRLFSNNELRNHLFFCHKATSLVKSYRLDYQHSRESLNKFYEMLSEID